MNVEKITDSQSSAIDRQAEGKNEGGAFLIKPIQKGQDYRSSCTDVELGQCEKMTCKKNFMETCSCTIEILMVL